MIKQERTDWSEKTLNGLTKSGLKLYSLLQDTLQLIFGVEDIVML